MNMNEPPSLLRNDVSGSGHWLKVLLVGVQTNRSAIGSKPRATRAAAYAGYSSGKVDFQTLLSAVIDVLNLNQEYFRAIADHEIAIAKLKEIIGDQS